jgi:HEXXH motif-containing protein
VIRVSATTGQEPWLIIVDGKPLDLPPDIGGPLSGRLVSLDSETVTELEQYNLHVLEPVIAAGAVDVIDRSIELIRAAPGLESTIRHCVHEIILLKAPDKSFDVSHSEPRWPTRIFISVPASSPVAEIRVAEAVVHEAMHLNMTFLERYAELVAKADLLYSPWKEEARPISGVLHGLYVFACINRFFQHVSRNGKLDRRGKQHVDDRITDIGAEVASIDRISLVECLTPNGAKLAHLFFATFDK